MGDAAVSAKADMLAAARKKLKDFESRQKLDGRSSPASSIISSEPGGGAALNGRSSVVSDDSTALQLPQSSSSAQNLSRNGTNASPLLPNGNEWYQAYTQLKTQHDELCVHYAQLHSAYSQVNAKSMSTPRVKSYNFNIDLRQSNEHTENLRQKLAAAEHLSNQKRVEPTSSTHSSSEEVRKLTETITQKDSLLTARHQELEGARREVASVQASLLNVQHERSEAQARVKSLIEETAARQKRNKQLKKDIQMKDLYLKQKSFNVEDCGLTMVEIAKRKTVRQEPRLENKTRVEWVEQGTNLSGDYRVTGGQQTPRGAWPWIMQFLNVYGQHRCGGSLIDPNFVLTAAHCFVKDRRPTSYSVRVGGHTFGYGRPHRVNNISIHPLFNTSIWAAYDYAIVRISPPVKTSTRTLDDECGQHSTNLELAQVRFAQEPADYVTLDHRLIGGSWTRPYAWPWTVQLLSRLLIYNVGFDRFTADDRRLILSEWEVTDLGQGVHIASLQFRYTRGTT